MSSTPYFFDRVQESSTTTGTGTYTLAGAITGFQDFSVVGNSNSCYYCAQEVDANGNPSGGWEVGKGTYTSSGTTLSRDTILASSNSNNAVNWSAGTRRIFLVVPAQKVASSEMIALGVPLPGAMPLQVIQTLGATGKTDLYTVPAGKKLLVGNIHLTNTSGSTAALAPYLKLSGTYYRLNTNTSVLSGGIGTNSTCIILEPGDTLTVDTNQTNTRIFIEGILFDSTSPLKTARLLGLSTGDNTLYTCPANKTAWPLAQGINGTGWGTIGSFLSHVYIIGDAGGTRTGTVYLVPNGESTGSLNLWAVGGSVSANSKSGFALTGITMQAGDSVVINMSTGDPDQVSFISLVELSN